MPQAPSLGDSQITLRPELWNHPIPIICRDVNWDHQSEVRWLGAYDAIDTVKPTRNISVTYAPRHGHQKSNGQHWYTPSKRKCAGSLTQWIKTGWQTPHSLDERGA